MVYTMKVISNVCFKPSGTGGIEAYTINFWKIECSAFVTISVYILLNLH